MIGESDKLLRRGNMDLQKEIKTEIVRAVDGMCVVSFFLYERR